MTAQAEKMDSEVVQESEEITNLEKMRGLPWAIAFNTANQIFAYLTFFGPMIVLFLNQLGFSKTQIGTTLGLIYVTGILSVFLVPLTARIGYKRTFRIFMSARAAVVLLLLFTPLVVERFTKPVVVVFIMVIVGLFAFFHTVALTGWNPWSQEYVPNHVRGKFSAISSIFTSVSGFLTVLVAGWVIGEGGDLNKFMYLFAASLVFAVLTVWPASKVPGGKPKRGSRATRKSEIIAVLRSKPFLIFMLGTGLVTISLEPMGAFLPLFLNEEVGLSAGVTIYIQAAAMMGGILSSYIWGWTADRYGSRPVMLWGLFIRALVPVMWFIIPRQAGASTTLALLVSFISGIASMGWAIGSSRMLFVSLVPSARSADYMAVWSTWGGITWSLSQVLGGRILDLTSGISGSLFMFKIDSYAVLFLLAVTVPILSIILISRVKEEKGVSVGEFVSLFVQGNPFMALNSMIGFQRARDEHTTVMMTERLGQSHSPLTVEELLEALSDPRFNVRFEAIISIARREPDPRLTHALCTVLEKDEPALGVVAAWALGRIGDQDALESLRDALDAPYRSVQAHSARSLGTMQDETVMPLLVKRLAEEQDMGLKVAFASALGKLGAVQAIPDMLKLLHEHDDRYLQMEIALALARMVGEEYHFIHLMRGVRNDPGTTASRAVSDIRGRLAANAFQEEEGEQLANSAAAFAHGDIEQGIHRLLEAVGALPLEECDLTVRTIIKDCVQNLKEFGNERLDYLILLLHCLEQGCNG